MSSDAAALDRSPDPSPARARLVVGIPSTPAAQPVVSAEMAAELAILSPDGTASVLFLARRGHGAVEVLSPAAEPLPAPATSPLVREVPGPSATLPVLLGEASRLGASACVLAAQERSSGSAAWLSHLVNPILDQTYDLVCPAYARSKLDGTLHTGIVLPLLRSLFGTRLRQSLGIEMAFSRKLAEWLLDDESWLGDPLSPGAEGALLVRALAAGFRVCQSFLGPAPERSAPAAVEPSDALAGLLGPLFREMEREAAVWQRISGSAPAPWFGGDAVLEPKDVSAGIPRLVDAFELGYQNLREIWGLVLPPATLLDLKRTRPQPGAAFRMDGDLWVRIVYDFALGHHMRLMDRAQMLRAMTPLYMGWLASFLDEVKELEGPAIDERIERIGRCFEDRKPYLISRWRWPDRFNP